MFTIIINCCTQALYCPSVNLLLSLREFKCHFGNCKKDIKKLKRCQNKHSLLLNLLLVILEDVSRTRCLIMIKVVVISKNIYIELGSFPQHFVIVVTIILNLFQPIPAVDVSVCLVVSYETCLLLICLKIVNICTPLQRSSTFRIVIYANPL